MKIAMIGSGAAGSVFASYLRKGGADMTLVDPYREHMDKIARDGMKFTVYPDKTELLTGFKTAYSAETFKHILLPVWTAAYRYNGKSYRFVVNGQSGRVQGERPWSVWKIAFAVLLALALAAALLALNEKGGYVRIGAAQDTIPDLSTTRSYRYHEPWDGGLSDLASTGEEVRI